MVIQHNLQAMNANRQLNITVGAVGKSTQKLSSGYQINYAADNAAGLAISEKMRRQIRGLGRASDNSQDGISLLQTADGALNEVHEMLQRMNELCVQAANGTNSLTDRQYIQDEIDAIKAEIDRVSETVKFNEIYLLDGHLGDPLNAGVAAKEYKKYMEEVDKHIEYTDLNSDGSKFYSLDDIYAMDGMKLIYTEVRHDVETDQTLTGKPTLSGARYENLKKMLQEEIVPQAVMGIVDTLPDTFGYLRDSAIGIGLELYSDSSTNVLASVEMKAGYSTNGTDTNTTLGYKLSVNMAGLGIDSNGNVTPESRIKLEQTIVHEMMHGLMDEALTAGMAGFDGSSFDVDKRFPDWFVEGMAQVMAGDNGWVGSSDLPITSTSSLSDIQNAIQDPKAKIGSRTETSQYGTGYLACMYLGYLANGKLYPDARSLAKGVDIILNDIKSGKSLESVLAGMGYANIEDFQNKFGDNNSAGFVETLLRDTGSGSGGIVTGKLTDTDLLVDKKADIGLFKLNTENDQVSNKYPTNYEALAGGNKNQAGIAGPAGTTSWAAGTVVPAPNPGGTDVDDGTYVTAADAKKLKGLKLQIGADSDRANRMTIYIEGMGTKQICVHEVDVTTEYKATRSIEMVAFGLRQVSRQRSILGAYQNRLEHTVKNLDNVVENTQASESLIRDTDMAEEMEHYTNYNVLQQAGQAMLAQANQSNQGILQILS